MLVLGTLLVGTVGGCSSSRLIEVRKADDRILSCRQLRSEIALAQQYADEYRKKAGIQAGVADATAVGNTIVQGSAYYLPIPGLGAIINAVISLFQRGISPKKALKAIQAAEARLQHLGGLADLKSCNFG